LAHQTGYLDLKKWRAVPSGISAGMVSPQTSLYVVGVEGGKGVRMPLGGRDCGVVLGPDVPSGVSVRVRVVAVARSFRRVSCAV